MNGFASMDALLSLHYFFFCFLPNKQEGYVEQLMHWQVKDISSNMATAWRYFRISIQEQSFDQETIYRYNKMACLLILQCVYIFSISNVLSSISLYTMF